MTREEEWDPWPSYGLRLGRNLHQLRRIRGLTQEQLATLSGIARNSISNIERNLNNSGKAPDPQLTTIYQLARALDVPPAVLLPAGDAPVADICSAGDVGISIRWPAGGPDLRRFRRAFAQYGSGPRYEDGPEPPQAVGGRTPIGE
ncbi:XRE family transcriptional regulator [Corynebacterium hylobatis]|uniref:XRE family transcriptional regulator n=1 Tax=Corynebacterium hylobatis TaxID=1859290 RepID=A0A430HWR2_9CORY|nr:helix-turn-helix transcriptional regulator [Corynebacterium hylobatis]RSZ61786.1 XRE family transcriptional regulator [Corynebacterium hylobatis]